MLRVGVTFVGTFAFLSRLAELIKQHCRPPAQDLEFRIGRDREQRSVTDGGTNEATLLDFVAD